MDTLNGGDSPRALFTSGLTPRWSRRPAQSNLQPRTSGPPAAAHRKSLASHTLSHWIADMIGRIAVLGTLSLVACAPSLTRGTGRPAVVPIEGEAHHHVVFQAPLVRVFDVRVAPGDTTLFHVHADPHAGVVISGSARWGQRLGQAETVGAGDSVGTLLDNVTSALPYTHRVANIDSMPFRYVMGQFLKYSGIVSSPLPDETGLRLERETPRGRVYRIHLLPGQATSLHRHAQPGLLIQIGNGTVALTGDASAAHSVRSGAGAWWWREAGNAHALRNASDAPVDLIEIDWK